MATINRDSFVHIQILTLSYFEQQNTKYVYFAFYLFKRASTKKEIKIMYLNSKFLLTNVLLHIIYSFSINKQIRFSKLDSSICNSM